MVLEEMKGLVKEEVKREYGELQRVYSSRTAGRKAAKHFFDTKTVVEAAEARREAGVQGFEVLRHAARFFNNEMWFEENEIISILQACPIITINGRITLDSTPSSGARPYGGVRAAHEL